MPGTRSQSAQPPAVPAPTAHTARRPIPWRAGAVRTMNRSGTNATGTSTSAIAHHPVSTARKPAAAPTRARGTVRRSMLSTWCTALRPGSPCAASRVDDRITSTAANANAPASAAIASITTERELPGTPPAACPIARNAARGREHRETSVPGVVRHAKVGPPLPVRDVEWAHEQGYREGPEPRTVSREGRDRGEEDRCFRRRRLFTREEHAAVDAERGDQGQEHDRPEIGEDGSGDDERATGGRRDRQERNRHEPHRGRLAGRAPTRRVQTRTAG